MGIGDDDADAELALQQGRSRSSGNQIRLALIGSPNAPAPNTVGLSGFSGKAATTRGSNSERSTCGSVSCCPKGSRRCSSCGVGCETYSAARRTASAAASVGLTARSSSTETVLPTTSASRPSGSKRTVSVAS